jgi:hypothetical protein
VVALTGGLAAACVGGGPKGSEPVRFDAAARPPGAERFPNWPVDPAQAEALMRGHEYEVRLVERTQAGTSGAEKFRLWFDALGREIQFKVKRMPDDLDGINNAPRKEIAAYRVQALFLDPEDWVVPVTLARCATLEVWREYHSEAKAQVPGSHCVLIVASLWLEDVTVPETLHDEERFAVDPTYARFLADFNLFGYLVDHRDGRSGNILVSRDDARRQVFAIDNGIAFGPFPYNFFVPNWNVIRVAALRKEPVDRLRELERGDLDFLLVAQQLADGGGGHYRDAEPGPPLDADGGAVAGNGIVQLGLTRGEIDELWVRIQALLEHVDAGGIPLF